MASAVAMMVLAAGCASGDEHADHSDGPLHLPPIPNAAEGTLSPVTAIVAGDCLNQTESAGPDKQRRMLPCSSPHRYEVYAVVTLSSPAPAEYDRLQESIPHCESALQGILDQGGRVDRDQVVVEIFDDYQADRPQRAVVCAIAHQDFRQTATTILR